MITPTFKCDVCKLTMPIWDMQTFTILTKTVHVCNRCVDTVKNTKQKDIRNVQIIEKDI